VFLLSGAEDLVPVPGAAPGRTRYRPRTEGLFARMSTYAMALATTGEVRSRKGWSPVTAPLVRPERRPTGGNLAAVADPANPRRTFGWKVSETVDPVGNLIRYVYRRDHGDEPGHRWDNPVIERMSYADYGDRTDPSFLVEIEFDYEQRPDPHSDRRAGFEVRTSAAVRCDSGVTRATDGVARVAREYRLGYEQAQFTNMSIADQGGHRGH